MTRSRNLLGALLAAIAFLPFASAHAAETKTTELSKEDKACLECHAKPGFEKTLVNGEKLSLHIVAKGFAQSVHADSGCEACHSDIDLADHGKESKPIASKRDNARALNGACKDCHKKTVKQYQDSVHAAMVQDGSAKAPLCSDCHNPHATRSAKDKSAPAEPIACTKCHEGIATAYAESVHGSAGDEALACKDCHKSHAIKAASFGDHIKSECLSCHGDTATTHAKWLPNTQRHLDAVACAACHSPGAQRRVNLMVFDGATQRRADEKVGVPQFIKLASADNGAGVDARALWSLLQDFNRDSNGAQPKTVLRGRLEVRTGVQAHRLAKKSLALADCDTCHRAGAESFQSVTVTIAGPDGRPLRRDASQAVLNSVESIESVGGFYAIGGTRIKLLDALLVLTLAGGIALPGAHLTMKWLSKRMRAKKAAAAGEAKN